MLKGREPCGSRPLLALAGLSECRHLAYTLQSFETRRSEVQQLTTQRISFFRPGLKAALQRSNPSFTALFVDVTNPADSLRYGGKFTC